MLNPRYHVSIEDWAGNRIDSNVYETEAVARSEAAKALRSPVYAGRRIWLRFPTGIAVELTRAGSERLTKLRGLVRPTLRRTLVRAY